ncbi:hypothetical protein [Dyella sp. 2RAB6]|uniref:hypothetical protein n=1 Tax=Dyella sp. 2RAB6 TaxID=3232992 RepID=UPI003F8F1AEE
MKAVKATLDGLNRGASTAQEVSNDIAAHDGGSMEYLAGYLSGHFMGLLGMAAARMGSDGARGLLVSVTSTFEQGVSVVESGSSARVQ